MHCTKNLSRCRGKRSSKRILRLAVERLNESGRNPLVQDVFTLGQTALGAGGT